MDRIIELEKEIAYIKSTLSEKENELLTLKNNISIEKGVSSNHDIHKKHLNNTDFQAEIGNQLPNWAIVRYSRQILLSNIGVTGQQKLCNAKVLIVGVGGLGCPSSLYLAGAGVGLIGLIDYDTVDITNIHRQVLHGESDICMNKVESAAQKLRNINSRIKVITHNVQLTSSNADSLVTQYDIVLDCTDNVPTRYLINDACVMQKVPLISASALKMDGQMTIYGYKGNNEKGPCYRCLFPTPAPPETVGSCSANGVAGPVPGIMGAMQALEAIKLIVGLSHKQLLVERMVIFDGEDMTFRVVRLRPRNPNCAVCSDKPTITQLVDYEGFCQAKAIEKKQASSLKSLQRKEEKLKRMSGQCYLGFRKTEKDSDKKWIQDVPKSQRCLGKTCQSEYCGRESSKRKCKEFTEERRSQIFNNFWNELDWSGKKWMVRSLVDSKPPTKRRTKIKGEVSRKGDSKSYNLFDLDNKKLLVCRNMFLNTLGIKEAMVRCWLEKEVKIKEPKPKLKSLSVEAYIESLPKRPPKCQICRNMTTKMYLNLDNIKNQFQLYRKYVNDMKMNQVSPASRKTFSRVFGSKNVCIFKPKNDSDVCDLFVQHNNIRLSKVAFVDPSLQELNVDLCQNDVDFWNKNNTFYNTSNYESQVVNGYYAQQ